MATCTNRRSDASTAGATSYTSGAFTPAAGELLVAFMVASDCVLAAPTMSDTQGLGWTLVGHATARTTLDTVYCFVANAFAAASSMTVTFDCTGDQATGNCINVIGVTGITKVGSAAVRQIIASNDQAGGGTPATTFAAATLTQNPCLGGVMNGTNPGGVTVPTGWTGANTTGYNVPTTGQRDAFRNSGNTSATITWGGTSASPFGVLMVELTTALDLTAVAIAGAGSEPTSVPKLGLAAVKVAGAATANPPTTIKLTLAAVKVAGAGSVPAPVPKLTLAAVKIAAQGSVPAPAVKLTLAALRLAAQGSLPGPVPTLGLAAARVAGSGSLPTPAARLGVVAVKVAGAGSVNTPVPKLTIAATPASGHGSIPVPTLGDREAVPPISGSATVTSPHVGLGLAGSTATGRATLPAPTLFVGGPAVLLAARAISGTSTFLPPALAVLEEGGGGRPFSGYPVSLRFWPAHKDDELALLEDDAALLGLG